MEKKQGRDDPFVGEVVDLLRRVNIVADFKTAEFQLDAFRKEMYELIETERGIWRGQTLENARAQHHIHEHVHPPRRYIHEHPLSHEHPYEYEHTHEVRTK